jgi:hypothetical protein
VAAVAGGGEAQPRAAGGGVEVPAAGTLLVTVDPVTGSSPNRDWRRYGTDRLLQVALAVAEEHAAAHPGAARLVIGDLSRPPGGAVRARVRRGWAPLPPERARRRRLLPAPRRPGVDRFVRAGAQYVFVGPRSGLHGPPKVVMTLANHDDHLHVRIRPGARVRR